MHTDTIVFGVRSKRRKQKASREINLFIYMHLLYAGLKLS